MTTANLKQHTDSPCSKQDSPHHHNHNHCHVIPYR